MRSMDANFGPQPRGVVADNPVYLGCHSHWVDASAAHDSGFSYGRARWKPLRAMLRCSGSNHELDQEDDAPECSPAQSLLSDRTGSGSHTEPISAPAVSEAPRPDARSGAWAHRESHMPLCLATKGTDYASAGALTQTADMSGDKQTVVDCIRAKVGSV